MRHNTRSSLPRRQHTPMSRFDTLPAPLRRWLTEAALPWSAASALRLWREARTEAEALARLSAVEAHLIARDAARIWGAGHPAAMSTTVPHPSQRRARSGASG